ncbi:hypothetical protein JXM67_02330 [candidate division WOR-3 bacterium]|nr:hypothetical protein [candidate division WOR-3 bacterium]
MKTDVNGDTLWTRTFGGESYDYSHCVQSTSDGGYVITGGSCSFGDDFGDLLLIKTDSLGYAGVTEPVQVTRQSDWEVVNPLGRTITLRYENRPAGFHAVVFDAAGRKVDEISAPESLGEIRWGEGCEAGVYFIRPTQTYCRSQKVVIVR